MTKILLEDEGFWWVLFVEPSSLLNNRKVPHYIGEGRLNHLFKQQHSVNTLIIFPSFHRSGSFYL